MKKLHKFLSVLSISLVLSSSIVNASSFTNPTTTNSSYNRTNALNYMKKWTTTKNTAQYASFTGIGGDCTNYVSQVLRAGGMTFTSRVTSPTTNHWYYYTSSWGWGRTATWTGAHEFRQHWGAVNGVGKKRAYKMTVYTITDALKNIETIRKSVKSGDVIQHVRNTNGDTYHSQVVYESSVSGDVKLSEHSGFSGDNYYSLKQFLTEKNNVTNPDWVCVIQIKSN